MSVDSNKTKLELLREQAGPMAGPFESDLGKEWQPRAKQSDKYYKDNSTDWDDHRKLYAEVYREMTFSDGTKVIIKDALAKTIVKNWIADLWAKLPDPQIRSRRTRQTVDFDKSINALAEAIHDVAGTDRQFKRGLTMAALQGGFVVWPVFEQRGAWQKVPVEDEQGQLNDEQGEPMYEQDENGEPKQQFEAYSQRVRNQMVPLSKIRFDPNGREADLYDDRWIGRLYDRSLADWWKDERIDKEQRRMLVNAVAASDRRGLTTRPANSTEREIETDPEFINVQCIEIHARTTKQIIHLPVISGEIQRFHVGPFDWDPTFAQADFGRGKFPCRLVPCDWNPPDKDDSVGRYPLPMLRDVRGLLEDRIRLYDLFWEAAHAVIDKYFTIEGVATKDAITNALSSDAREIVFLKRDDVMQALSVPNLGGVDVGKLIRRFETSDKQLQAMNFATMIERVEAQIYETVGQGPADRGGIEKAESATATANIRAKMEMRMDDASEENAQAYDDITELDFLLLASKGTLPIPYQRSSDGMSEPVWDEFLPDLLEGEDFSFSHVRGSSRPENRQAQKIERKDFLATAGPFLANEPDTMKRILYWVLSAYDYPDLPRLLESPVVDLLKQLLAIEIQIGDNPADAASPILAKQKQEIISQLIKAGLSENAIQEVVMASAGRSQAAQQGAGAGTGSKSLTPGQQAAGAGAAGQTNVM